MQPHLFQPIALIPLDPAFVSSDAVDFSVWRDVAMFFDGGLGRPVVTIQANQFAGAFAAV